MSYFKMVEFLVKEVAKANEQIESLTRKAEDDKSVIDRLCKVHDKYFSEAKSAKDDLDIWKGELDSCSNQLRLCKEDLVDMTIEKDHWKEEALEYRDKESNWWKEEKQYKAKIKGLSDAVDRFRSDYLNEADSVGELENELSELQEYYDKSVVFIDELTEENKDLKSKVIDVNQYRIKVVGELEDELKLTKKRYEAILETNKEKDEFINGKIQELQLEINHLKNNK